MTNLIKFFINKKMLTNIIFVGILVSSMVIWFQISKEEMPSLEMDWLRISVRFPGSSAEDSELMITRPIENELKGISGIFEVKSNSSAGNSSFRISIDPNFDDKQEVIREIKDSVLKVDLPKEASLPLFRQFKTSEKAIIDIAFMHKDQEFLTVEGREKLQEFILSFESQLVSKKGISSIDKSGYLIPQLKIEFDPYKIKDYHISVSEILKLIELHNIRAPLGSLLDKGGSQVVVLNELDDKKSLDSLILRKNYDGKSIKLSDVAKIAKSFERPATILKVQGKEAMILNVKKSPSIDILSANEIVIKFVKSFKETFKDLPFDILLMDDESKDVRNRLKLIIVNGILGTILILIVLIMFLDIKTAFWVALGIPFSLSFTIVGAFIAGYTMNNVTLAAIIIVLGIVVDDAIIIAENILRHNQEGKTLYQAAVDGTSEMFSPITASVLTTCVAFVPLLFFQGHFGKFISFIPLMVTFMLLGSLLESIFILPSHIEHKHFWINRILVRFKGINLVKFDKLEKSYALILRKLLNHRLLLIVFFISLLTASIYLFKTKMKFVMFPREETERLHVKVEVKKGSKKHETARIISKIENMFVADSELGVTAVRSQVGQSRRGGEVKENNATMRIELLPKDERNTSVKNLIKKWEKRVKTFVDIEKVKFIKSRFGRGSGSPIEIQIQENDNLNRELITKKISEQMNLHDDLGDVEIEEPLKKDEIIFELNQGELVRLGINPNSVITVFRSFVEGITVYKLVKSEEEVEVVLTVNDKFKLNLDYILGLKIENNKGQLIDINKVIKIIKKIKPSNINRINYKRTTMIYADLKIGTKKTPLEIAEYFENNIFPEVLKNFPSAIVSFVGEVEDSRSSKKEFNLSVLFVVVLIYFILVLVFNSLIEPFIILAIIPFSLAGVTWILLMHGMSHYGFFTIIGALGMIGVVVNDSIVMVDKLNNKVSLRGDNFLDQIAMVSSTRLRAILLTTFTTVVAILPTAYGVAGYDSMLAEMMLTMGWGLAFATIITLVLTPCLFSFYHRLNFKLSGN